MIPKKIHYCWFGGNPLPEEIQTYIDSWKKHCPDYELIRWDETNYDVTKNAYVQQAYHSKKWAFLSDYVRLDVIYEHGGIYLDTDVELIRSLDGLLDQPAFMGMEQIGTVNTGLGFGAVAGNIFISENKKLYEEQTFQDKQGNFKPEICVKLTTQLLKDRGLTADNKVQQFENITIYPTDYFCPLVMGTNKLVITPNTYSIHHYSASWYGNGIKRTIKKALLPLKLLTKKVVENLFGDNAYDALKKTLKK